MRILLIDKNLVEPVNYKKWEILSSKSNVELRAVFPSRWMENFRMCSLPEDFKPSFPVRSLPVVWPGFENRSFYLRGLAKEIRKFKPEVIIGFEEPFSLFALQITALRRLYARSAKLILYSWDNLAKGRYYPYRPRLLYGIIERIVLKQANLLLTANREGEEYFRSAYDTEVRKLYFGVDLNGADRINSSADIDGIQLPSVGRFVVGYVGRLLEMKGIDTLLKAISICNKEIGLVIVGSGPFEDRLKTIAVDLGISQRVSFISAVDPYKARLIIRKLDVLVLPSLTTKRWKEQFGRVLVEAMSCGVPVIGSSSGAIPEVIGDAGIVFNEGDPVSLARAIGKLESDKALRIDFSRRGLLRSKEFSAERFADRLYSMLNEL
ncbi:MAG: glycosyltransferase family 4 protein [Candidatus Kryptoniota bacterium]